MWVAGKEVPKVRSGSPKPLGAFLTFHEVVLVPLARGVGGPGSALGWCPAGLCSVVLLRGAGLEDWIYGFWDTFESN